MAKFEKSEESKWRPIKKNFVKSSNYFDGRQYGYVSNTNEWVDYPKKLGEVNYTVNIYQDTVMSLMTELSRGAVELSFRHITKDSYRGQLIKKICEVRYAAHRARLFDQEKLDQERMSSLLNGVAARYTYFNWNGKTGVPEFGQREGEGQSATVCAECGVPVQDAPCSRCGSEETKVIQAAVSGKSVNGYGSRPTGENEWVSVDPLGLTFYLQAASVEGTPYIIWRQSILNSTLQSKYKDTKISEGKNEQMMDKAGAETATPNVQGDAQTGKDESDFIQAWFDYSVYCHRKIDKDIRLRNGTVLKADTTLGEAFPDGLYLAINGQTVLDVWNEDKNKKWTIAPYVARLGTMVGAGTSVAHDTQDRKNDLKNLHMANAFSNSFPWTFVNTNLLEGEQLPDDPREVALVTQLPEGGRIVGNVVDRLPATSLSSDAYGLEEKDDQTMQRQTGSFSGGSAGLPDLKAIGNTATGYLAYRNAMLGRMAPMMARQADSLDKKQAYQLLENDQKHLTPEQWKIIAGDYGAEAVKAFLQCDIRSEVLIEVVGESYMPASRQDTQAKIGAFTELIASGIPPDSELAAHAADQYDIPLNLVGFNAVHNGTMVSIDKMRQASQMIVNEFGDVPTVDIKSDPRVLQLAQLVVQEAQLEVIPGIENHPAIIDAVKDWWITDEARASSNLLKASVILYEQKQELAIAQDAASKSELQMVAQAPQMQMQQEQQQQMQAQQQQRAQQEQQGQVLGKIVDVADKERDREHKEELASQAYEAEARMRSADKVQQAA